MRPELAPKAKGGRGEGASPPAGSWCRGLRVDGDSPSHRPATVGGILGTHRLPPGRVGTVLAAGRAGAFLSHRWPKCSQPHLKASPTCRPLAGSLTSSPSEPGRSLRCLPCGGAGREPQCSQHWSPRSRERVPTCHRRLFLVSRARLQGHLYFPHLTDRETEAREGTSLCPHVGLGPEMAQLGAGACPGSPRPAGLGSGKVRPGRREHQVPESLQRKCMG